MGLGGIRMAVPVALAAGLLGGWDAPGSAAAAGPQHALRDGVYSERQARRGRRVYRQACVSCHAEQLEGGEMGPGLVGPAFLEPWVGASLEELMDLVRQTMPQDNPGGLGDQAYIDLVAYLLRANEYPAGEADLTADSLATLLIELPD